MNNEAYLPDPIDREDFDQLPEHLQLWCRDWYPTAKAITESGYDVLVYDPDVGIEQSWWDTYPQHGVIEVKPAPSRKEWCLIVRARDCVVVAHGTEEIE